MNERELLGYFRYVKMPTSWLGEAFSLASIRTLTLFGEGSDVAVFMASFERNLTINFLKKLKKEDLASRSGRKIKIFDMPGVVDKIMDDEDTSTTDIEKICVFDKKDVIDEVLKLHEAQSEIGYNRL